eukprot:tig00021167_g19062.t1
MQIGPMTDDEEDDEFDDDDSLFNVEHGAGKGKLAAKGAAASAAAAGEDARLEAELARAAEAGKSREEVIKMRKLHRIFVKGKRRFSAITIRYVAAFLALFFVFFVWFVYAYVASQSCEYFTAERNYGGLRKSLTRMVFYYAQELLVGRAGTFGAEKDYIEDRNALEGAIHRLAVAHRSLEHSNKTEGLPGIAGRTRAMDTLLFGTSCLDDRVACSAVKNGNGLSRYLNYYIEVQIRSRPRPPH